MKKWKDVLICPTVSIHDAIEAIERSHIQIVLVVDAEGRLLGTVTDGDIRRGILKGIRLDQPIHLIMKKKPVVARENESRERILSIIKKKVIHQIPILDEAGRVVGIEILDELIQNGTKDNWVVLMAGGEGVRLFPLTRDCPKPLLNIGKKPILETILESFIEYGFHRFYLSVNYKNEMIKNHFGNGSRWGIDLHYIDEREKLGTAGSLAFLPEKPKQPLIVMNGDLLTKINFKHLLNFHLENNSDATMCIREYDFQVPYGVVRVDQHLVRAIDEKPIHRFFVNAGIYVLEPEILKYIAKNKRLDMPQLFHKLKARKKVITGFPVREYWLDIGRIDDLERAKRDFPMEFESAPI